MNNQLKTFIFLVFLASMLMLFGYFFAGIQGFLIGFILSAIINGVSYWFSDRIILSLHHAKEVEPGNSLGLYEIVERLAQRAEIPMPKVYIIPAHAPNAFATGRDPFHAAIAVTQGLLGLLDYEEIEGVLSHEIAHIKNRDTLISSIAATFASAILFFAQLLRWSTLFGGLNSNENDEKKGGAFQLIIMAFVMPIAATLIQFAISRTREFTADITGARLSGKPQGLASALRKISSINIGAASVGSAGLLATAHLYIINPFNGSQFLELFSTHPPVEERIRRLLNLLS